MFKFFTKILISMFFTLNISAQICDINISTTSNLSSCSSYTADLIIDNANYFVPGADYSFNFNSGSMPSGWSVSGSASFSTPCGTGPDGNYYWASSSGSTTPEIQTKPLDICSGGTISFDLKYAIQSESSPCEGPDLETEGVSIEYSIDNGATWIEFKYFRPDGTILDNIPNSSTSSVPAGATTPFTDWDNYTISIPAGAISTSTKFRWIQYNSSGSAYDNWGLDNITVNAGPCIPSQTIWSTGEVDVNSINKDITTNQCFTAGIYDLSNNLICESNEICFEVLDVPTLSVSTPSICVNEMSTIEAIVSPQSIYDYTWTVPSGVSDPGNVSSFTSNIAGTYTVSISNSNLFCNSDFEDDNITSAGSYSTVNQSSVSCWNTTASNSLIEVWGNGFNGVPAYSGIQFIELNATQVSSIYQDFTVVPGSSVSISFAHRGRNGTDVLSVEIGPIGGPYDNLGTFSAGNTAWEYNSVNYTFPDNGVTNYTLRFNSVSAAGGATMGNFLDAISIVNSSCLPSPASSILVVSDIDITNPGNQTVCDSYTLPSITGTNLSGNENYYDDSQANGGNIIASPITSTQTVWIYDVNGSCFDEESFLVTINQTPVITNPGNQTVCDSYTLPTIIGSNLSGNENYYDDSQANAGQILSGPLTSSQTVWIYDANGACSDEISFNVTVNLSPSISNNPGALTVCAPYTLPTITGTNLSGNENYYDDSQANGGQILTGPLNSSQTIWIYDSNNSCSDEESYALTVDNTPPTINNLGDQSACNTFSLPIISGTNLSGNENYYDDSQANSGQILTGPISSTQTIWMYDQNGTCSSEESFVVTINTTPSINNPGNQTVCDSYSLPSITGSNLSGTENFYDNTQANDGQILSGPLTSTQTVWIYDNNGSCSDETSFDVTVNYTPTLNTPADVTICDSYGLNIITGTNLSGNENYYDNSQANGGVLITGPITSSQTVWIYDADGACTDETSFNITINLTPSINNPGNSTVCDSYSLPSFTGTNLSGNENYYDDSQANGGQILTGPLTSSQTIWMYDSNGTCSDEESYTVTINFTPSLNAPGNQVVCDTYSLPVISGTNLSGTENFYDNSQANGGQILSGPLTSSQTIWIYDEDGSCNDELSYTLTVNYTPNITVPGNQTVCDSYNLPVISGINLSGNQNYYDDNQANGGNIITGPLTSSQTIWIYDNNGNCSDEQNYQLTVDYTPVLNSPGDQTVCDSYNLPIITGLNLSGNENYYDNSQVNGGQLITGPLTTSQSIWIYDSNNACSDELNYQLTINYTPSITNPGDQTVCDSYNLPSILGLNLSGNENYYDDSQANGGNIISGPLTTSQVIWIYDEDGSCNDETNYALTVNYTPALDSPGNQIECDTYSLPIITGTNLSGNENFYDDSQANGGNIVSGPITSTQTIWLYDENGSCNDELSFDLTINTTPTIDFTVDTTSGCLPLAVKFLNNSTPQYDQVNWDFGDGNTFSSTTEIDSVNHIFNTENCFDIKLVASSNGCVDSLTKTSLICTYPKANAEFTVDAYSKTVANPFFEFNNLSTNASIYFWDFDDDETSIETDPKHEFPNDPRKYYITLIANNAFNCSDTTGQFIELKDELIYYIPNAFTPNNDEFNNTFKPVFYSGYEIDDYTMYIFNRWGQLIFESHDPAKGWNGRYGGNEGEYCPDEMYVWKIHFKETTSDKEHIISGHVILYK